MAEATTSQFDSIVRELNAERRRRDAERQRRYLAACAFLAAFYQSNLRSSQVLQDEGIEVNYEENKLVLDKPSTGHYHDPLLIMVDEQASIDCAGRSVGRHAPEHADEIVKALIAGIVEHFDL